VNSAAIGGKMRGGKNTLSSKGSRRNGWLSRFTAGGSQLQQSGLSSATRAVRDSHWARRRYLRFSAQRTKFGLAACIALAKALVLAKSTCVGQGLLALAKVNLALASGGDDLDSCGSSGRRSFDAARERKGHFRFGG